MMMGIHVLQNLAEDENFLKLSRLGKSELDTMISCMTSVRAMTGLGMILLFITIVVLIRNIYFHPLSHVPGPKLYASSRLPYMWAAVSGRLAVTLKELHDQHGPVVRTATNEVSFIEPQAWEDIHNSRDKDGYLFRKNYDTFNETKNHFSQTVFLAHDEDRFRMRKALNPAFSERSVRLFEGRLAGHIDNLIEGLRGEIPSSQKSGVDLNDWFNWLSFDVAADYTIGVDFNCVRTPLRRTWLQQLSATWKFIVIINNIKALARVLTSVKHIVPTRMLQKKVDHLRLISNSIEQQKHSPSKRVSAMSMWSVDDQDQGSLRPDEVVPNANLTVAAGTDTGATVLPGIVYLLSQNPEVMKKVVQEIRSSFKGEDSLTISAVSQLPYLRACISETLRLYTAVPEGLPRIVPDEGAFICGYWIPGGTFVQVSGYAANMSKLNFVEPERFVPERWLTGPECDTKYAADRKFAARPFSYGPGGCLGQNLANAFLRLTIAKFLYHFDILEYCGNHDWIDQKSYMLWERVPLHMKIAPAQR